MDEKVLEIAETQVEAEKEAQIERIRGNLPTLPKGFDGKCLECGIKIPKARLKLSYATCIECQSQIEHQAKHFRGSHNEVAFDLLAPFLT